MGGSPGQVVMGGDSWTGGRRFQSQHHILDVHFSHLFVVKIVMCVWKDENKRWRHFIALTLIPPLVRCNILRKNLSKKHRINLLWFLPMNYSRNWRRNRFKGFLSKSVWAKVKWYLPRKVGRYRACINQVSVFYILIITTFFHHPDIFISRNIRCKRNININKYKLYFSGIRFLGPIQKQIFNLRL